MTARSTAVGPTAGEARGRRRTAGRTVAVGIAALIAAASLASCSAPARADEVRLDEIELPPGLERYEGADETTLDVALGLAVLTQPDVAHPGPYYFVGTDDDSELDAWFVGAAARAGFEAPEGDTVLGSGPWHIETGEGDQYLSWGTIPVSNGDGTFRYIFALYLTPPD